MSITKKYLKTKPICKVTFKIPEDIATNHKSASLVGDFNKWNADSHKMKKLKKDGSFKIELDLPIDSEYKFRYLLDGNKWLNDENADNFTKTEFGDSDNCIIKI